MSFFCYFIFSSKISTFFFFNIYLFIYLTALVFLAAHGIFSHHCSMWHLQLQHTNAQLQQVGSNSSQESNLGPLHREYRVLAAVSSGKSLNFFFNSFYLFTENSHLSICFNKVCSCFIKHGKVVSLKALSQQSNIWVNLVLLAFPLRKLLRFSWFFVH